MLVLGGGEGATARDVLKSGAVTLCVMCEIDQAVVDASKEFLPTMARALAAVECASASSASSSQSSE